MNERVNVNIPGGVVYPSPKRFHERIRAETEATFARLGIRPKQPLATPQPTAEALAAQLFRQVAGTCPQDRVGGDSRHSTEKARATPLSSAELACLSLLWRQVRGE